MFSVYYTQLLVSGFRLHKGIPKTGKGDGKEELIVADRISQNRPRHWQSGQPRAAEDAPPGHNFRGPAKNGEKFLLIPELVRIILACYPKPYKKGEAMTPFNLCLRVFPNSAPLRSLAQAPIPPNHPISTFAECAKVARAHPKFGTPLTNSPPSTRLTYLTYATTPPTRGVYQGRARAHAKFGTPLTRIHIYPYSNPFPSRLGGLCVLVALCLRFGARSAKVRQRRARARRNLADLAHPKHCNAATIRP